MADDRPPSDRTNRSGVVVITGGARGIGLGIAEAFAAEGACVMLVDVDPAVESAGAALRGQGVDAHSLIADVAVRDELARCIEDIAVRCGRVDVLVNNAQAGANPAPVLETTPEHLELAWRSGLVGTFNAMQLTFPHLRETGGCVINLVSGAALSEPPGFGAYAATKSAIKTLTRVAATEWGPAGVRVNAISPAARTPALEAWAEAHPDDYAERIAHIPLGRMGDARADVGAVAVFLASPAAAYITGQTIVVDGGVHHLG
jgi:NAD(P)-dependent dehydrogenase (short-subunit alcohol dehydrogenase family)